MLTRPPPSSPLPAPARLTHARPPPVPGALARPLAPALTPAQQVSAYYLIRWLISYRDPEREKKEAVKKKNDAILRRLDANGGGTGGADGGRAEKLVLNSYEQTILGEVVAPEDIHVSFNGESARSAASSRADWRA